MSSDEGPTNLPSTIDPVDLLILQTLQQNSKTQYRELADKAGVALGTVANRIAKLTARKVIKAWSLQLDPEALGYDLTVLINIQIDVKFIDYINEKLREIPELFAIYNITGEYDIIALGRFQNRRHLDITIHRILNIDHIARTSSNVALRTLKEDFKVYLPRHGV